MAPLTPGETLAGRFQLQRPLGRGGAGEVWLAVPASSQDMAGPEAVALKIITGDPERRARHRDAAVLARRLVHPNIVRTLEVLDTDAALLVVMEYVDGGTLAALRGAGYREIVAAVLEVVEALQYAHAQGVVHRDLKPANVLRDRHGHCKVADFGLAVTGGGSLSGASPAQLDGAAPSPADDLYGLGALLHDLLAGQPPLHPGITPERIRTEVPEPLGVDGQGDPIPRPLVQLVSALLAKSPSRRPAGMGAVRVILEDVLEADRAPVMPAAAPAVGWSPAAPADGNVSGAAAAGRRGGLSGLVVVSAGVLLLAAVGAVIFYLPDVVRERGPLVVAPAELPGKDPAATADPAAGKDSTGAEATPAPASPRVRADAALARYREEETAGKAARLERWAAAAVATARRAADLGEQRYQNRDFEGAVLAFEEATAALAESRYRAPAVLAAALADGEAALAAGRQSAAVSAFEAALDIQPEHPPALAGLERARRLDQVLAAMTAASARESAGDLAAAAREYQAVLDLDPQWTPAREGLDRVRGRQSTADFEARMARGFQALEAGEYTAARTSFEGALAQRPGDQGARDALAQVRLAEAGDRLAALGAEAARFVGAEQWQEAATRYRRMVELDSTLVEAREGLARAEARAALDRRLKEQLAATDRLNDDAVATRARSLLAEARAVEGPGPVLAGQVAALTRALAVAAKPVTVRFESDNLTTVTILKVGALGAFEARTVDLRPGTYTVVGTREGYRDVRRTIRVGPEGLPAPVALRCEEPI